MESGCSIPRSIAVVAVLLGIIALTACLMPARKAAKVNPAIVLSELQLT